MSNENLQIDDALLDRLVDDELGAVEKRQVLASLDDEPSGWRRCALAFLEAQAWRGTLGGVMDESVAAVSAENRPTGLLKDRTNAAIQPQIPLATPEHALPGLSAWKPLGIAAGIMLAFTIGMLMRGGMQNGLQPDDASRVVQSLDQGGSVVSLPRPDDDSRYDHMESPIAGGFPGPSATNPSDDAVLFVVGGNGSPERQVRVPLIESPLINEQFGRHLQPAVPETVRRRLERSGFRVESQRRFAPVWANGGQQMLVPVDDTKIVPVKRTVY